VHTAAARRRSGRHTRKAYKPKVAHARLSSAWNGTPTTALFPPLSLTLPFLNSSTSSLRPRAEAWLKTGPVWGLGVVVFIALHLRLHPHKRRPLLLGYPHYEITTHPSYCVQPKNNTNICCWSLLQRSNMPTIFVSWYVHLKCVFSNGCVMGLIWRQVTWLHYWHIRWGADKSLARTTYRCRRSESVVSLERGVCSCAELHVFSCYRERKEAYQATGYFNNIEMRDVKIFACKLRYPRKFTPFSQKH
jgi:hypothetical protein